MSGERASRWAHPWFAAVVGPRPSEEEPAEEAEDSAPNRRRSARSMTIRRR
ncbi:hypothetical protein LDL08_21890 [Nonomuraea glycinis]|jgi:hypothetical protein|uniref:Uncharacterized protein n=1 Tax=Nonomuraea glycinis TaxID=2047744 RepID=A0A918A8Z2_9ACTN|nr:hypothetical protein [Nonomuraea glycinis]MCA2178845.1 hypothetical protein [Nonomuraea glycinis]WSG65163.1 hypothetical protein OHA68_31005 [Nonomuraea glycinis]GGP08158.1 hypothetical protein GCM10012278_38750 [Nonomuraea glycinis]